MIDRFPTIPDEKWDQWTMCLAAVVVTARLVAAFDGTDRQSLDFLKDALYELGEFSEQVFG